MPAGPLNPAVLAANTYTSVLTDLLAYAAEATARLVLAAAAANPGSQHRRSDPPKKSPGPARSPRGKPKGLEARPPTRVPPTSHKDQGRIARKLYGLVKHGAPRRT
jgi:hypothetical protein